MEIETNDEDIALVPFVILTGGWRVSNPTYADLAFRVVDITYGSDGGVESFKAQCLLCGRKITPFGNETTKQGRKKWQRAPLVTHLKTMHNADGELYKNEFSSIDSLVKTAKKKNITSSKGVDGFFPQKRQLVDVEVEEEDYESKVIRSDIAITEDSPSCFRRPASFFQCEGLGEMCCIRVAKTMRVIVLNIPLSWNRRTNSSDLYFTYELATYDQSDRTIPLIYKNTKRMLKSLIPCFAAYSLSCDCWSTLSLDMKVICFFIHVYHNGKYKTMLLDAVPINRSDSDSINKAFCSVCEEYGLDKNCFVTTDNASSNVSCFGSRQNRCVAHAISTSCVHTQSSTPSRTKGLFLEAKERKIVREYFELVESVCGLFRRGVYREFCEWFAHSKSLFPDISDITLKRPPKVCETRWLGKTEYLRWLRVYGVAVYRFLCVNPRGIVISSFYNCLKELPEVLAVMNVLNNALNLLTPNKCTAHLVLPVFSTLSALLDGACPGFMSPVAKLICYNVYHELQCGCLNVQGDVLSCYRCASGCYPFLCDIAPSLYDECLREAENKYSHLFQSLSAEEQSNTPKSRKTILSYITHIRDDLSDNEVPRGDTLRSLLKYCPGGVNGVLLKGTLGESSSYATQSLIAMSEKEINEKIRKLKNKIRTRKSRDKDYSSEIAELSTLLDWKQYGGSEDDHQRIETPAASGQPLLLCDGIKHLVSEEKSRDLYSFPCDKKCTEQKPSDPMVLMMESSLHLSASEADCERFFRIMSQMVKRSYVSTWRSDKACQMAFLSYYSTEIYYAMVDPSSHTSSIYDIFFNNKYK